MLSRVADSLFWMSRYIERAENIARFIQVTSNLSLDYPGGVSDDQWSPLIATSGDDEDFAKRYGTANEENVIRFLTFDDKNPNSIFSCLRYARENGRTIRDTISSEMWEQLNQFFLRVQGQSRKRKIADLTQFYTDVKNASHLFIGIADTTMSHGEGWHFARMGRLLERADKTARILDVKYFILLPSVEYLNTPLDSIVWGALLKSASAFEMYRKKHRRITYRDVADFLIFDESFPRSLYYCVRIAEQSLKSVSSDIVEQPNALREIAQLRQMLLSTSVEQVQSRGLHEFIDTFQYNLNIVGKEIYNSFVALKTQQ